MIKRYWFIFVAATIMFLVACTLPEEGVSPAEPVLEEEISDSEDDQGSGLADQLNPAEFEIALGEWQLRLLDGTVTCPNGDVQKLPKGDPEEALISNGLNGATIIFEGFEVSEAFELTLTSESAKGASYAGLGQIARGEMIFTLNFFKHPNSQDPSNDFNAVIGLIEGDLRTCKYHQGFSGGSVGFYQEGVPERITVEGDVIDPVSEFQTVEANTDTPEVGNWHITYMVERILCGPAPKTYGPSEPEIINIDLDSSGEDMFVNGFGISATIELVRQIGPNYSGTLEVEGNITEYILGLGFYPIGNNLSRLDGVNGILRYSENNCVIIRNFVGEFVD